MTQYKLSPSVGVARLGSSEGQFLLSPDALGGLPFEADANGNKLGPVQNFKDDAGQVRRQGQVFTVFDDQGNEITADSPNVESILWTAHLANKKAAWYQYSELQGNLLFGPQNSYAKQGVPLRNPDVVGEDNRRELIVDPGPRSLCGPQQTIEFDKNGAPAGYPVSFPPDHVTEGLPIKSLGTMKTDDAGRLVLLGGYGHAGGNEPLTSYGGSNTWHDDISDGPVYCDITFKDDRPPVHLQGWCIVGSPDFVPEIPNISTLSDTMFDVGVRCFDLVPDLFSGGAFNPAFRANYQRDILPIVQRIGKYQWLANVQSMSAFVAPGFDMADNSEANRANRETYYSYFREPNDKSNPSNDQPQNQLFAVNGDNQFPMMPLNSGSNSVSNQTIIKFLALNDTQHFLLGQWAQGLFDYSPSYTPWPIPEGDQATVGNCVGLPMCPGIEVTWSTQNPNIYRDSFVIYDQKGKDGYNSTGLTPSRDETNPDDWANGQGCQPGDLTKRMACPWQADFFQCTIQYVNFSNPDFNKDALVTERNLAVKERYLESGLVNEWREETKTDKPTNVPLPPTYYTYWWPPQSPWDVITGEDTVSGQSASHLPAGQQVNYARGINSFVQMVEHWSALAFIRNRNAGTPNFPYFTEVERNNELFSFREVGVGTVSGNGEDNETTLPVFYIEQNTEIIRGKGERAKRLCTFLEKRAFKSITIHSEGLGEPRCGTRARR